MARGKGARTSTQEIVAIDLGTRVTKAVLLRRRGTEYVLAGYRMTETPVSEKGLSEETLVEHLRAVWRGLQTPCKRVVLLVDHEHAVLTHADIPQTSPSDLRKMIKLSPKTYLQQDLPDHLFDCYFKRAGRPGDTAAAKRRKGKVLVGAARRGVVERLVEAAVKAGLNVVQVSVAPVAVANAFRMLRDDNHPDAAALLDIGSSHSTISVMYQGDLVLTRTVKLGAEMFADVLSPSAGSEAMAGDEENALEALSAKFQRAMLSFAREVDASVGFFASQFERHVTQLLVCGGSARSQSVLQSFEGELNVSCEGWNLARHLTVELPEGRAQELEFESPQLIVAVGAAVGVLREDGVRINLLAEQQEQAALRRRDPVRRAMMGVGVLALGLVGWAGTLAWEAWSASSQVALLKVGLEEQKRLSGDSYANMLRARELEASVSGLAGQATNRMLFAPVLDALQHAMTEDIELQRVMLTRGTTREAPPAPARPVKPAAGAKAPPPPPPLVRESVMLTIQGRNYGDVNTTLPQFVNSLSTNALLRTVLRDERPILITQHGRQQSDVSDGRPFHYFTLECHFKSRIF